MDISCGEWEGGPAVETRPAHRQLHILYARTETASRGYVLQTGAIIASGTCERLKNDERVKEAYLGRR